MATINSVLLENDVLHISLNRPEKRNALSRQLIAELTNAVREISDQKVAAVVISGNGVCFSAGADFSELEGNANDENYDQEIEKLTSAIRSSSAVVIAAIHGVCIGAGLDFAFSCDLRVSEKSSHFSIPSARAGILYNPKSLAILMRGVRPSTLARLLLQADVIPGPDAFEAGIVTHLVSDGEAKDKAFEIANSIAELPSDAVTAAKMALNSHLEGNFSDIDWEKLRRQLLGSEDRSKFISDARQGVKK